MALIPTQDNKYSIRVLKVQHPERDGYKDTAQLVNHKTGVEIPPEEPVFLFRGKDALAAEVLYFYAYLCDEHGLHAQADAVRERLAEFINFVGEHPERVSAPSP